MPIYDVSVALANDTPTYPGDPGIEITEWHSMERGDAANVSLLRFGAHTGTHVDAPAHFIPNAPGVKSLSLDVLIGKAQVIEVPDELRVIDEEFVKANCVHSVSRFLFKTRNSAFWNDCSAGFRADYTYIEPAAARTLVGLGAKLVGIDYLSVEAFKSASFDTHQALLSAGVVIVEGLDLREVSAGRYELICLPLRLCEGAGDGAPARAVLRTLD
jgi:arylformamidase